jgi:hypothetical protein
MSILDALPEVLSPRLYNNNKSELNDTKTYQRTWSAWAALFALEVPIAVAALSADFLVDAWDELEELAPFFALLEVFPPFFLSAFFAFNLSLADL